MKPKPASASGLVLIFRSIAIGVTTTAITATAGHRWFITIRRAIIVRAIGWFTTILRPITRRVTVIIAATAAIAVAAKSKAAAAQRGLQAMGFQSIFEM